MVEPAVTSTADVDRPAGVPETAMSVGVVDDFPEDAFRLLALRGGEVGVYRSSDGRWYAVRNLCPHRGAPVCQGRVSGTMLPSEPGEFVYGMEGEVLRCPWHAMEFSLATGESLFGVTDVSLSVYEVFVAEDEVWVSTRRTKPHRESANPPRGVDAP